MKKPRKPVAPYEPQEPTPPRKTIPKRPYLEIYSYDKHDLQKSIHGFSISYLVEQLGLDFKKIDFSKLYVDFLRCEEGIRATYNEIVEVENKEYDYQNLVYQDSFKLYQKAVKNYDKKLEAYNEKLKIYKKELQKYDEYVKEQKIAEAKAVLAKYGS